MFLTENISHYFAVISFLVFLPSEQKEIQCGIKLDDITKAISPSNSPPKFAPWVVSIGFGENIEEEYDPHCTGTIIGGRF